MIAQLLPRDLPPYGRLNDELTSTNCRMGDKTVCRSRGSRLSVGSKSSHLAGGLPGDKSLSRSERGREGQLRAAEGGFVRCPLLSESP